MGTQLDSSSKSIAQDFPASGPAPAYRNKHYRRDRRVAAQKCRESDTARWRMEQTKGMIADLERMVDALNIEIQAEEVRSGVNNSARIDYPTLATALRKRRDNVMRSIDLLRRELAS